MKGQSQSQPRLDGNPHPDKLVPKSDFRTEPLEIDALEMDLGYRGPSQPCQIGEATCVAGTGLVPTDGEKFARLAGFKHLHRVAETLELSDQRGHTSRLNRDQPRPSFFLELERQISQISAMSAFELCELDGRSAGQLWSESETGQIAAEGAAMDGFQN